MEEYLSLVSDTLENASYKPNRTGVDTVSSFSQSYKIDLQQGFPLLTTKKLSGYRWNSLIHELLWYFSGEEHIRNLTEKTSIWDPWADDEGRLQSAYGRFWRRYPVPDESSRLDGEAWPSPGDEWVDVEGKREDGEEVLTFDQIGYVVDTLKGDNPDRDHRSRRLVVTAWHPANAAFSNLPPCHFTWVLNVQGGKLNTHLTQRSGDIALGVPFNIAAYSLVTHVIARQTDFEVGEFSHTVVDSHIYCGEGDRGAWYGDNIEELRRRVREADSKEDYLDVRDWVTDEAPEEEEGSEGLDHVPGLLEQLSREPRERPSIRVPEKPIDELEFDDFELEGYDPHPGIEFEVAE